ncbi:hypothetical protein HDU84_005446 [Entophlyctis sp. JEL0112]|nr:hypothetical protein HDU84_005446 [Entophlyctis sp. JEL0112]
MTTPQTSDMISGNCVESPKLLDAGSLAAFVAVQNADKTHERAAMYLPLLQAAAQIVPLPTICCHTHLDGRGFSILHYVALEVAVENDLVELVEWLIEAWDEATNSKWSPTAMKTHPLMSIEAQPEFEKLWNLEFEATTSDFSEKWQLVEVLGMKGFSPLAVAARVGNFEAIKVFVDKMNANPFSQGKQYSQEHPSKYVVPMENVSPVQVCIDFGLPASLHTLMDSFRLKMANNAGAVVRALNPVAAVWDAKVARMPEWPRLVVLDGDESTPDCAMWDVRDAHGTTPLHAAVASPHHSDEMALILVQTLLHHGVCSPLHRDISGRTIVATAVIRKRSTDFFRKLLELRELKANAPAPLVSILRKLRPGDFARVSVVSNGHARVEMGKAASIVPDAISRTAVDWAEVLGNRDIVTFFRN